MQARKLAQGVRYLLTKFRTDDVVGRRITAVRLALQRAPPLPHFIDPDKYAFSGLADLAVTMDIRT